jgi:hypothetical protein
MAVLLLIGALLWFKIDATHHLIPETRPNPRIVSQLR